MKTAVIVIDGLSDDPIPDLGGKTPLEASFAPNTHYIATRGQIGRIRTTFTGYPIESVVCIMGLLGYDPASYYPGGRSSFEAMAKGIPLASKDLVFRCNIVTADLQKQVISDFTAGMITDSNARRILSRMELPSNTWELYPGQSYRNILIVRNANADPYRVKCFEPHMNVGKPLKDILPRSNEPDLQPLVEQLNGFLLDSQRQIETMDLPSECAGNMLWVWSPSIKPTWPSFKQTTGLDAAFVGGLDFLHGIAMAANIHFDVIPGATGYIDTNYVAKAEYAVRYLRDFDFVLVHVNATDEEAHQHNHRGKIEAIEKVDRLIVGPVLYELQKRHRDDFRVVVCGDHETRCSDGKHVADPVPFAVFGKGISPCNATRFSESDCLRFEPLASLEFLKKVVTGTE
jgi:2,3-bisphosphoglycerate-independent phosphoglycerate mutase